MLLDLPFAAGRPALVAGLSLLVVALKAVIAALVVRWIGYPTRIAVIVGLGLAQIGEFSFVIGRLAHSLGLIEGSSYQSFLAAAIVTLGATPFLMRLAPEAGVRIARRLREKPKAPATGAEAAADEALANHVVIVGYGLNGRNLARVLSAVGIPYIAIDLSAAVVARAREAGEPHIAYGDATRAETLHQCGVERAAVVVFAVADPDSDRRGVSLVRSLSPTATIIVRTRLASQVAELRRLGADEVIPEEFETSIAIFARVLRCLHVPANIVRSQELLLRTESYEFLREGALPPGRALERASELFAAGTTDSFLVTEGSFAAGRTIRQTALHTKTRTMIIAVVREGRPTVSPGADFAIRAGDILVLVGDHAALEAAFEVLAEGGAEPGAAGDGPI
jgi:CPA2 family monovalent cation:H+ antiporter-2